MCGIDGVPNSFLFRPFRALEHIWFDISTEHQHRALALCLGKTPFQGFNRKKQMDCVYSEKSKRYKRATLSVEFSAAPLRIEP